MECGCFRHDKKLVQSFFVAAVSLLAIDVWSDVLGILHDTVETHKDVYSFSPLYSPVRWNMRVPHPFSLRASAAHTVPLLANHHTIFPPQSLRRTACVSPSNKGCPAS